MKSVWKWTAGLLLGLALLVAVVMGVAGWAVSQWALPPDWVIRVDGEPVLSGGLPIGASLMLVAGLVLAVVVVVLVVPLALLLGLGLPLLLCAGGLLIALLTAGVALALIASPFIVLGLLLAWALRSRRAPPPPLPSAT